MYPRIVVSRCLGFDACRWDATIILSEEIENLRDRVEFVTVCPEQDIGLGVPRKPIELVLVEGSVRMIQKKTMRDVTDELISFTKNFVESLGDIDGFILKSKSPSCGRGTTKIHSGPGLNIGSGVFASFVSDSYPDCIVLDEVELEAIGPQAFLQLITST